MRWFVWREIVLITRMRVPWIAMGVQAVLLTVVMTTWGDGVPALSGTFDQQFARLHLALLLVMFPWLAARCSAPAGQMATLAAVAATSPRTIFLARTAALLLALTSIALIALPFYVIAYRIADVSMAASLPAAASAFGLAALASALVTTSVAQGISRMTAWLTTTAALFIVLALAPSSSVVPVLLLLSAAVGTFGVRAAEERLGTTPMMSSMTAGLP
jgi:hypothetical protein